jgi:seryl-tRNA synthetase
MIDMAFAREHPEKVGQLIKRKSPDFDIEKLLELDQKVRDIKVSVESLRQKKNELASHAKSGVTPELRQASIAVGKDLKAEEQEQESVEASFKELSLSCPNIPFEDVPEGNKEENVVVREHGVKPTFSFDVKNHLELGEQNKWFNLEAATKIAASNFVFYQGEAVKMMYGLAMFMLKNNSRRGFEPVIPPYVANEQTLTVSGNFPKFKDEVFSIPEDNLYLIPTSEVCLANLYRDEIIPGSELPKKMTSWTSCFRREAGNYGKNERGLIRIHQFEKVELFALSKPEKSEETLNEMVSCAEELLQKLGLHYRVSLLAAQDCSFQSAKTFDIEVWLPGQDRYYEVSSASNCTDFQARRGKIRYRDSKEEKTQLVHTLNASALALPRLMVALMETYQQEDGTIKLPEVLKNEMF